MGGKVINEDPNHLGPLWEAILDIYEEFCRVCDRHGLRHYVVSGTLLGAVRHKGFIPWDDDFDLAMPRPDYDKFKELAKTELPCHLQWMDWHNTSGFRMLFGKVMDCRQEKIEGLERILGHQLSNGLFVDVFPIDGYPDSGLVRFGYKILEAVFLVVGRHYAYRCEGVRMSLKRRMVDFLGSLFSFLFPVFKTIPRYVSACERYLMWIPFADNRSSAMGGILLGKFHLVFPPRMFGCGVKFPFEGVEVRAPMMWRKFLESHYGNYMKLPPEEKRHPTHDYGTHCPWWLGPVKK